MRFLVDENTGPTIAHWLSSQGHDVFSVYEEARGLADPEIIQKAASEGWIIITSDKDFGRLVFRDHSIHSGVILLRLSDQRSSNMQIKLLQLLTSYPERIEGQFIVVTETQIRFARRTV